jgi:hypothetical protein
VEPNEWGAGGYTYAQPGTAWHAQQKLPTAALDRLRINTLTVWGSLIRAAGYTRRQMSPSLAAGFPRREYACRPYQTTSENG